MKNVLIVDDEPAILMAIADYLEEFSDTFTVTSAENGRIAAELLADSQFNLVITDLKMPEMDGFELLAFISAHFPSLPVIVMTAFVTPDIREKLESSGMLQLLEKPIDFEVLAQIINKSLNGTIDQGALTGISLPNFLQLIEMEKNTCLMEIGIPDARPGLLYFNNGILYDAAFIDLRGEEAVYALLRYENVKISFRSLPNKTYRRKIRSDLITILMEGARRNDEEKKTLKEETSRLKTMRIKHKTDTVTTDSPENTVSTNNTSDTPKGELEMADIKEVLEKMKVVGGFMAAGVFTPNGEMVADCNVTNVNLGEMGALANDVLLKAQKATEMMNVGRGQVVHIEAPQAHIVCRCLNENTDFSTTAAGKAHLHMVLALNKEEGNIAMGKMKLEAVINELVAFFR